MIMLTIGQDPGASSGALALLLGDGSYSGKLLEVTAMPFETEKVGKVNVSHIDRYRLSAVLGRWTEDAICPVHGAVEQVGFVSGQGGRSSFNFGQSYGEGLQALASLGIPTTVYRPAVWKDALGLLVSKEEKRGLTAAQAKKLGKDKSRAKAMGLWPECADWFARAKDDGVAEAALIAWFHYRLTIGELPR